jgi:uncharacterized protein with GYD domain
MQEEQGFEVGGNAMPLYVRLVNLTEKGLRDFKDTVARAEAFRDLAKKHGATVKEFFWTDGGYDMVTIIEAPNDTVAAMLALDEATHGFRRVQTLRAFTAEQMEEILKKNGGEGTPAGLGVFLRHA